MLAKQGGFLLAFKSHIFGSFRSKKTELHLPSIEKRKPQSSHGDNQLLLSVFLHEQSGGAAAFHGAQLLIFH